MSRRKKNADRGADTDMPYLCWPVGRSGDVREILGIAAKLKVSRFHAIGWVVCWEELVFTKGNASGLVSGIRPRDLAAALDWKGEPAKLIGAFRDAGLVSCVGQELTHPHWTRSRTAAFLREKEETRRYWREWKAEKRRSLKAAAKDAADRQLAAASGGGGLVLEKEPVHWTSGGLPIDVQQSPMESNLKEVRTSGSGRPPSPPQDAGGVGSARWEIVDKLHPWPMNSEGCTRLLAAMSAEDWALCLWVLETRLVPGLSSLSLKKRAFRGDSYKFLKTRVYLRFRPDHARELAEKKKGDPIAESAELKRQETEKGREMIRGFLTDPTVPEKEKERRRSTYLRAHPGDAEWIASLTAPPSPPTPINGAAN